jgi:hypothetical protein
MQVFTAYEMLSRVKLQKLLKFKIIKSSENVDVWGLLTRDPLLIIVLK